MSTSLIYCATCGAANDMEHDRCFACQGPLDAAPAAHTGEPLLQGRYRLLEQLGTGGFGAVYQAEDCEQPELPIAIKQINLRNLSARQIIEATETFERERAILARLNHPHLPRLHATFEDAEHWYLVIDYFSGETLEASLSAQSRLLQSAMPERARVEEALRCGLRLCELLDYLHTRTSPVIFRDLKPGNIIRGPDGSYALIDFGIARTVKPGQAKDTIPLGSPGYAAPEQYGRAQTDARADIYSLGAILHQMLSGHDPSEQPLHFATLGYSDPPLDQLEALILSMVSLKVEERPESVAAVTEQLRAIEKTYQQPGARIWIPQPGALPPELDAAGAQASGGAGQKQIQLQIQRPLTPRQRRRQARQQAKQQAGQQSPQQVNRTRRNFLIALVAGGVLVGSGTLGKYLVDRLLSPKLQDLDASNFGFTQLTQVIWSPDGRYLIPLGQNPGGEGFMLWDVLQKTPIYQYTSPYQLAISEQVMEQAMAWSPDNQFFALAEGSAISLWPTYKIGIDGLETLLYILPDGSVILGQYRDITTGTPAFQLVNAVIWSPDGRYLAYMVGHEIRIWDVQARKLFLTYRGHAKEALDLQTSFALQWSPNGKYIASVIRGTQGELDAGPLATGPVHIWSAADGAQVWTSAARAGGTNWLQWSPDSNFLIFGNNFDYVSLYDLRQRRQSGQYPPYFSKTTPGMPLTSWSPDGSKLATFFNDEQNQYGMGQVWSNTSTLVDALANGPLIPDAANWIINSDQYQVASGVSWSPDGRYLLLICRDNQDKFNLYLYETTKMERAQTLEFPGTLRSANWSPDGHMLVAWGENATTKQVLVRVYEV